MSKLTVTFLNGETKTFESESDSKIVRYKIVGDWVEISEYRRMNVGCVVTLTEDLALYNRAAIIGVIYE